MLSIDEAIEHAREKANEQRYYAEFEHNGIDDLGILEKIDEQPTA